MARLTRLPGAIAVALGVVSATYAAMVLGAGSLIKPGPGLWPLLASGGLIAGGTALAIWPPPPGEEEDGPRNHLVAVAALAFLVGYAVLVNQIGLLLATCVGTALWVRLFGRESWLTSLVFAAGVAVAVQLLFIELLAVPLP